MRWQCLIYLRLPEHPFTKLIEPWNMHKTEIKTIANGFIDGYTSKN